MKLGAGTGGLCTVSGGGEVISTSAARRSEDRRYVGLARGHRGDGSEDPPLQLAKSGSLVSLGMTSSGARGHRSSPFFHKC